LAENGSIKGQKRPQQASNWLNRPQNGGKSQKRIAKVLFFAKTDRLNKYFRLPKRRQWDSTVLVLLKLYGMPDVQLTPHRTRMEQLEWIRAMQMDPCDWT
jgi:hypothetical protein